MLKKIRSVRKFLAVSLAVVMVAGGMTGCASRPDPDEEVQKTVKAYSSMDDLESGKYYIKHGDVYYALYSKESSFKLESEAGVSSNAKVLWYREDFDAVPTMYKGDTLVYKTGDALTESFTIERFEYLGYTIGICGLQQTSTGRYSYEANRKKGFINMRSDAARLADITNDTAIIETIGGVSLRAGNISNGGCILGLTKGKTYSADVYTGTQINKYKIKADCIALASMETYKTTDYTFLRSQIAKINLPDWFNSGYYYLGGNNGLFRYVNASSYDENTNFNVANTEVRKEDTSSGGDQKTVNSLDEDTKKAKFTVPEEGDYTITAMYEEAGKDENMPVPTATVEGKASIYALNVLDSTTLTRTIHLQQGTYTVTVSNLYGRTCDISVKKSKTAAKEEE